MVTDTTTLEKLIFKQFQNNYRYTQDSPVYPDVWLEFLKIGPNRRLDLILTPNRKFTAAKLLVALRERLDSQSKAVAKKNEPPSWELATSGESVAVKLTFEELISCALPLTGWWQKYLLKGKGKKMVPTADLKWLKVLVGYILWSHSGDQAVDLSMEPLESSDTLVALFDAKFLETLKIDKDQSTPLWSISNNRVAKTCLTKSVPSTKADAARRVFSIDGSGIYWAVLDTGIDARHNGFRKKDPKSETGAFYKDPFEDKDSRQPNNTRIIATYDFTQFRNLMAHINGLGSENMSESQKAKAIKRFTKTSTQENKSLSQLDFIENMAELERALRQGRMLDWSVISPLLRIPHNKTEYEPPTHPHGTHVAGIIGANLPKSNNEDSLIGMCPGIELYDIRVLNTAGEGDEFNILAAIQFIRWMNEQKDQEAIHGVNFSLSMIHEVADYACGQTPVCEACEKLVSDGTVVVAAAGNLGQAIFQSPTGQTEQGFRSVNITDPGNAESVITVGATHRNRPHTYGVSYFSSKGPTGDGRKKPDLVAPGEKVVSTVPDDGTDRMDGSSMSAPHVSGAAALLLDKHRELIGHPDKVKEILCQTATDLGREHYFQGYGAVDVLRALQSV